MKKSSVQLDRPLYESAAFQDFCEGVLRPGGLEITEAMLGKADFAPKSRVLDIGCGLGQTVALLARRGLCPSGVDASPSVLEKARKAFPQLDLRVARAETLPFEDDIFQGLLCECSFSLFPNPAGALAEMGRVLAPGGKLLLSDVYPKDVAVGAFPLATCAAAARPWEELCQTLEAAGFRLLLQQEASDSLRQFTARMVWEYGSAQAFWRAMMPGGCAGACRPAGGEAARPKAPRMGYAWGLWQWEGGGCASGL